MFFAIIWISTFVEHLFCQPLAIPKTAADITETSLEVEMDIYKSSILLSPWTVLFSHRQSSS